MTNTPVIVASAQRPVIRAEITHDLYAIIHRGYRCQYSNIIFVTGNIFWSEIQTDSRALSVRYNALKSAV